MGSTTLPPPLWSIDMHNSPSLPNSVQLPLYKNQIDTESVRSVLSDRSRVTKQQKEQSGHHEINHNMSNNVIMSSLSPYDVFSLRPLDDSRHNHSLQSRNTSKHSQHSFKSDRKRQTKVTTLTDGLSSNRRRNDEVIEVQIIPQDDTWGDNTTVVTGNTSDHSVSIEMDLDQVGKDKVWNNSSLSSKCLIWSWPVTTAIISFCAFISPIIMIILPKIETFEWKLKECGPECDGQLINFAFKLLILLICTWALFFRTPRYTLPRICNYRSTILAIIVFLLIAYWLFYSERILDKRLNEEELSYYSVVQFAISFVDVLLWTHYASIILIEIKQLQPTYFVKVVRSPDGESHFYNIGELSIQKAAIYILQRYYQDFNIYNPYLESLPRRNSKCKSSHKNGSSVHNHVNLTNSTLKYYNVDGITNSNGIDCILLSSPSNTNQITDRSQMNGNPTRLNETVQNDNNFDDRSIKRSRFSSHHHHHHHHHNDRFYEEYDYERRVKKRKARLLTSVEEAFTHIKRIQANESGPAIPMDPQEAAQAIFPSIARALQKFLRITRQQPRHTMKAIIEHLSIYLAYDLSPKSFLEKYFTTRPVLQNDKETGTAQTWSLVCDTLLSRSIEPGTVFMLRQNDISLLVTVQSLPHFNIIEEIIDPKSNKFVFRMNSETSV